MTNHILVFAGICRLRRHTESKRLMRAWTYSLLAHATASHCQSLLTKDDTMEQPPRSTLMLGYVSSPLQVRFLVLSVGAIICFLLSLVIFTTPSSPIGVPIGGRCKQWRGQATSAGDGFGGSQHEGGFAVIVLIWY